MCIAVVEQVDDGASLYSRSIQNHHVCLLVKRLVGVFLVIYWSNYESRRGLLKTHLPDFSLKIMFRIS